MRYHLSNSPVLRVNFSKTPVNSYDNFKPAGLWYDVDMDWIRWLDDEGYLDNPLWMRSFLYEITIDESRVIIIHDERQFDEFNRRFCAPIFNGAHVNGIDWTRVAKLYGGVEIAPYLQSRRLSFSGNHLDTLWYYGWDCASGVIWDKSALLGVKLVAGTKGKIVQLYRQTPEAGLDK